MFERVRPVVMAAAIGYALAGFLVAVAGGMAYGVWRADPFQQVPEWKQVLEQHANQAAAMALVHLLLFALLVVALFFWLGVAGRARYAHPTSATLAGLFLSVALLTLAGAAVWNGIVSPYVALLHGWSEDAGFKQALFNLIVNATFIYIFAVWCLVLFGAVGLYFLGRAVRGVGGWLPDALRLAAAFAVLHVPVTLYLARESLARNHYVRWLAVVNELTLWGALAVATYFSARWLRAEARSLFRAARAAK